MTHLADFTTKDLAASIMAMTGPYNESLDRATRAINSAIARAIKAEREECARVADKREAYYKANGMYPAYGLDGMAQEAADIAAAIRARSNKTK